MLFLLCISSLLVVLTASVLRGTKLVLTEPSADTNHGISLPMTESSPEDGTQPVEHADVTDLPVVLPAEEPSTDAKTTPAQNSAATDPTADEGQSAVMQGVIHEDAPLTAADGAAIGMTVSEIAEACSDAAVTAQCRNEEHGSIGSGFILSEDGYIVTNHHVIRRYDEFRVMLHDGSEHEAELVFALPEQDLALLKIAVDALPVVTVGSSASAAIGDQVVAIGTPGSVNFAGTVTYGYISGLDRSVTFSDADNNLIDYTNMIQITATINPGNSGGPLFNTRGELIAINTMKLTGEGFEGMGFAIPIDRVYPILSEQVMAHRTANAPTVEVLPEESVDTECDTAAPSDTETTDDMPVDERPYAPIGIRCETVTEKESRLYKIPVGVIVQYVEPGSNAERSGLRTGDIILTADGTPIPDVAALDTWAQSIRVGDTASLTVFRAGAEITVEVVFSLSDTAEDTTALLPKNETETETDIAA